MKTTMNDRLVRAVRGIGNLFGGAAKTLAAAAVAALALSCSALADTYDDGEYVWTYQVSNGKAEIYKGATEAAVDPKPEGSLEIPSELGGYPVTSIGEGAFYECTDLLDAEVPDGVTSIHGNAFYKCTGMSHVSLPGRFVGVISSFTWCTATVVYHEVVDDILWRYKTIPGEVVLINGKDPVIPTWTAGRVTIPSKLGGLPVTQIGTHAFAWCGSLTGVTIPDTVTFIGSYAFSGCTSLAAVTIPNAVTTIDEKAFYGCSALKIVSIPDSVTTIGANAFENSALEELHVKTGSKATVEGLISGSGYTATLTTSEDLGDVFTADFGGITWSYRIVDGTAELYKGGVSAIPDTTEGEIEIPSELDGHPVTRIGDYAFYDCDLLTGVTIPEGVTHIGEYAFEHCYGMKKVTIPYSVTRIDVGAFWDCSNLAEAYVPYTVTSIADGAFAGCDALADAYGFVIIRGVLHFYAGSDWFVSIPASVTRIGDRAFSGNSSVYSVDIPASVTSIGESAFDDCDDLAYVTIPGSVASIGDWAFAHCDDLASVTIPAGVKRIGEYAFYNCTSLVDVWIPSTVTDIGDSAFEFCYLLANVHVESAAEETRVGGLLTASGLALGGIAFYYDLPTSFTAMFDADGGTVSEASRTVASGEILGVLPTPTREGYTFHAWFADDTDGRRVTASEILLADETFYAHWIPEGYGVYMDDDGVEWIYKINGEEVEIVSYDPAIPAIPVATMGYVVVPETIDGKPVTRIGDCAFYGCSLLTEVEIPDGVTSIGEQAFEDCSYLEYMYIPDSVTSIGQFAFGSCAMLRELRLSDGLTSIEDYTFYYCSSLPYVEIPERVTRIGMGAFQGCSSLASVDAYDGLTTIAGYAFQDCNLLEDVYIPETVTEIGEWAFAGCGLTSVTIPGGVTYIGDSAFYSCASLTSVTISEGVKTIGSDAFEDCPLLSTVEIPATVMTIKDYAFYGCTSLETISIPYSVTSIGDSAFYNCNSLKELDIPGGVTRIGDGTFSYCTTLTHVDIPASVTEIAGDAFAYCDNLVSVSIPKSVTSIGSGAFDGCTAWTTVYVEVGDTDRVKGILDALSYTGKTYTESLPSEFTVTFDATGGTVSEDSRNVASGAEIGALPEPTRDDCTFLGWFTEADGGVMVNWYAKATADVTLHAHWIEWKYRVEDDEAELFNDYYAAISTKTAGAIVVPDTLGGYPVTRIGDAAFEGCDALTSVTLPATVTSIGAGAFSGCTSLLDVPLPAGLTAIEDYAFYGCASLSMSVPDGVEVGDAAFYGCDAMADADGFVIVGGIFHYYTGSDAVVTVPDDVTAIGSEAFADCDFLTSVTLPETVTRIGGWAFSGCSSLDMEIPDGVTEIGYRAFYGCSALASAELPASLTDIGGEAFAGCTSLAEVVLPEDLTYIPKYAFAGCSALTDVSISATVTDIGTDAFRGCTSLAKVHVHPYDTDRVKSLLEASGLDTSSIEFAEDLPEFRTWTDGDGVKWTYHIVEVDGALVAEIYSPSGDAAIPADTVGDITIPDTLGDYNVASLGAGALSGCDLVNSVTIPDTLVYICQRAFAESGVTSVTIPGTVVSIGESAFESCPKLRSVTLEWGVEEIGDYAFAFCSALEVVDIPDDVSKIGEGAFTDCSALEGVSIPSAATIGDYAFNSCSSLRDLNIEEGVTTIGAYAFVSCTALTDVVIPATVEYVGDGAFTCCDALAELTICDGVQKFGDGVFSYCPALTTVTIPASVEDFGVDLFCGCEALNHVIIEEGVTAIGEGAFYDCDGLTDVTIPESVTTIGAEAFYDCASLTNIRIPESVTSIGNEAFVDSALATVYVGVGEAERVKEMFDDSGHDTSTIEFVEDPVPTFTVTFDANGGTVSEASRDVEEGEAIGELPSAFLEGYTLEGWFTSDEAGEPVTADTVVTADMTIYAHWIEIGGGGSGGEGEGGGSGGEGEGGGSGEGEGGGSGEGEGGGSGEGEGGGDPVSPDPVNPDPVNPDPVNPDPEPVLPYYEVLNESDIVDPYMMPKAVTVKGAAYDSYGVVGIVELKLGKVNLKKGTGKVSGSFITLDGKKHKIKGPKLVGLYGTAPLSVTLDVKDFGAMSVTIGGYKFAGTLAGAYHVQSADVGGNWTGSGATVTVGADNLSVFAGEVLEDLLPSNVLATVSNGKWSFSKAAGVKWGKPKNGAEPSKFYDRVSGKDLVIDMSKGTNLSGLKLTYTPKKGTFKGSFKVYALQGASPKFKLKKYTVKVNGVVVGGVGYGAATSKKPAFSWSVTVR